ncbi:unnamed protein product [Ixodes hexagonus]
MDKSNSKRLRRIHSWSKDAYTLLSQSTPEVDTSKVVTALDLILDKVAREVGRALQDPESHHEIVRELLSVLRHVTAHLHFRSTSLLAAQDFPYWDYMSALLSYVLDLKLGCGQTSPTLELCFHTVQCKHRVWDVVVQSAAITAETLADRMPAVIDKLVAWCPKTFSDPTQFFKFLTAVVIVMKRCDEDDSKSLKRLVLTVEPKFDFPTWFSAQEFDLSVPDSKFRSKKKLLNYLCKSAVTGTELLAACRSLVDPASNRRSTQVAADAEWDEDDKMFAIAAKADTAPTVDTNGEIELALEKTLTRMRACPGRNADTTDCMVDSEIISDSSNPAVDPETFLQTFLNSEYAQSDDAKESVKVNKKRIRKRRRTSQSSPSKKSMDSEMLSESEEGDPRNAASPAKSLRPRKSPMKPHSGKDDSVARLDGEHSRKRRSSCQTDVSERATSSPDRTCKQLSCPDNFEMTTRLRRRKQSPLKSPYGDTHNISTSSLKQDDKSNKKKQFLTSAEPCQPQKEREQQQSTCASERREGSPTKSSSAKSSAVLLAEEVCKTSDFSTNADNAEEVTPPKKPRRARKCSLPADDVESTSVLKTLSADGSPRRKSPTKVSFGGSCLASSLNGDRPRDVSSNSSSRLDSAIPSQSKKLSSAMSDDESEEQPSQRKKRSHSSSTKKSPTKPHSSQIQSTPTSNEGVEEQNMSDDAEVTGRQMGSPRRKSRNPAELVTSDDEDIAVQNEQQRKLSTASSCSTTCIISSSDEGEQHTSLKRFRNWRVKEAPFKRPHKAKKSGVSEVKSDDLNPQKQSPVRGLRRERSPVQPASNSACHTSSDKGDETQVTEETKDESKTPAVSPSKEACTSKGQRRKKTAPQELRHPESQLQEKSPAKSSTAPDSFMEGPKQQQPPGDDPSSDEDRDADVISVNSDSDNDANDAETESIPSSDDSKHGNQTSVTEKAKFSRGSECRKSVSRETDTMDSNSSAALVGSLKLPEDIANDSGTSGSESADLESDEQQDSSKELSFKNAFSGKAGHRKKSSMTPRVSKTGTQAASLDVQQVTQLHTADNEVISARGTANRVTNKPVDDVVVPDSQECALQSKGASFKNSSAGSEKLADTSSSDEVIPETQDLGMETEQLADEGMLLSQASNCLDGLTQKPSFAECNSSDESGLDENVVAEQRNKMSTPAVLKTPVRETSHSPQLRPRSSRQSAIKARSKLTRTPDKEHGSSPEKQLGKPRRIITSDDDSDTDPDFNLGKKKTVIGFKPRTPTLGLSHVEKSQQSKGRKSGDETEGSQGSRRPSKLSLSQKRNSQASQDHTTDPVLDLTTPKRMIGNLSAALRKRLRDVSALTPPQTVEQQAMETLPSCTSTCEVAETKIEGANSDSENDFNMAASPKAKYPLSGTSVHRTPLQVAKAQKSMETVVRDSRRGSPTKVADKQRTEGAKCPSKLHLSPARLASNISQDTTQPMEVGSSSLGFQSPSSELPLNIEAIIDSLALNNDEVMSQTPGLSSSLEKSCCYCSGSRKETQTSEIGTMTDASYAEEASMSQASTSGRRTRRDSTRRSEPRTSANKRTKGKRKSALFSQTSTATPPRTTTERKVVTSHYNLRASLSVPRRLKY